MTPNCFSSSPRNPSNGPSSKTSRKRRKCLQRYGRTPSRIFNILFYVHILEVSPYPSPTPTRRPPSKDFYLLVCPMSNSFLFLLYHTEKLIISSQSSSSFLIFFQKKVVPLFKYLEACQSSFFLAVQTDYFFISRSLAPCCRFFAMVFAEKETNGDLQYAVEMFFICTFSNAISLWSRAR